MYIYDNSIIGLLTRIELCYRLLAPIGEWRSEMQSSKGRRWKKIQRRKARLSSAGTSNTTHHHKKISSPPEILSHLDVGINAVTRRLESISRQHIPAALQEVTVEPNSRKSTSSGSRADDLAVVFVCRSALHPSVYEHIPRLISMITQASGESSVEKDIRLVALPKAAEIRLPKTLNILRASVVGVSSSCTQASTLIQYAKENVKPIVTHKRYVVRKSKN